MGYDADQRLSTLDMDQTVSDVNTLVSSAAYSYDADSELTDLGVLREHQPHRHAAGRLPLRLQHGGHRRRRILPQRHHGHDRLKRHELGGNDV